MGHYGNNEPRKGIGNQFNFPTTSGGDIFSVTAGTAAFVDGEGFLLVF
jgi:hypothetical protein